MAVTLPAAALAGYDHYSLYNSPYPAHDRGTAIDLYPPGQRNPTGETTTRIDVPSPVGGEVLEARAVHAPTRTYAEDRDYLLLVDTGEHVARLLHVEPSVSVGTEITRGDHLGRPVRSGYFAPWVGRHLHLEFRSPDADPYRASGSEPIDPAVTVEPVPWDGSGTVVAVGGTYVQLDTPRHPAPGPQFAAMASDGGRPLDGGLVHYPGGGLMERRPPTASRESPIRFLGTPIGTTAGRDIRWADVALRANGVRITGLSLAVGRGALGAKLIAPEHAFTVGDQVTLTVDPGEPVRLG